MTIRAIVGMQWGDEGKGKIVDYLGESVDVVVRCQGGSNAGHTVVIGEDVHKLHLIPSGILRPAVTAVIGNGVVMDPIKTVSEIDGLLAKGIDPAGRLWISDRAHLVLPVHKILDGLRERARGGGEIGTTRQGIGPAYQDKAARVSIRGHELLDEEALPGRLRERFSAANDWIAHLGGDAVDVEAGVAETLAAAKRLRPFLTDTVRLLHEAMDAGKTILAEGAQGAMLDLDFGTYPYVTSSNTTSGGIATGSGIPPTAITESHGVLKAFTTRVGAGPFPTEVVDEAAGALRGTGANQWDEFGTTTGRPRRVGWLDLVVGRYSARVNGVTHLHITKLDVLGQFDEIKVCVAYRLDGETIHHYPASLKALARCEPVYEALPGWKGPIAAGSAYADLPAAARAYCERVREGLGTPIATVSFGPARDQTLAC